MLKRTIITGILIMFTITAVAVSFAAGPEGNKRKGKYTYRKVYKACMARGEVDSATPVISPSDKKQAEWNDIFESKNFKEFGCEPEWAAMAEKDLMDIYAYFWNHAADSPTPATCK